jgi:ATP-binding cassette subfamily G (WHITE) protein 1/ATP-binding cassette subfamily G (WHITE) protein 2
VLALFDRVLLLSGGVTAFDGTVEAAIEHFASLGCPCPPRHNPADHLIRLLSPAGHASGDGTKVSGDDGDERAAGLARAWSSRGSGGDADADADAYVDAAADAGTDEASRAGFVLQMAVLLERNALSMSRDPVLFYTRVLQTAVVSLVAGAVFLQLGRTQKETMDRSGAVFFILVNQGLAAIIGVLQTFPVERATVQREHAAKAYGIPAYFLAKTLSSLPFEVAFPFTFSTICFFMMKLRSVSDCGGVAALALVFGKFAGVCVLASTVATSMGLWISTAAPDVAVALALAPVVLMPFLLFSGFLVNLTTVSPAFLPLIDTSLFRFAFSALMHIIFDGTTNDCGGVPQVLCPFPDGAAVLRWFSLENTRVENDVVVLAALAVAWRLLAFITLLWRSRRA